MTEVVVNGLDVSYLREGRRVSDHGGGTRSSAFGPVPGRATPEVGTVGAEPHALRGPQLAHDDAQVTGRKPRADDWARKENEHGQSPHRALRLA